MPANDDEFQLSLRDDERGATMVMGLFMAVFLVGMLYYIVGLGDAIAYRERMQDTSDAGAFTAAVVNSRGMNLIVLLNMVMAAVMAILLSLKVIETVVTVAMGISTAMGALCFGCTAPAISFLNTLRQTVGNLADGFEPVAQRIINACHVSQGAVRDAWPVVGQGRAMYGMLGNSVSNSPAEAGMVFPIYASLPVQDHVFRETCDRGAQNAVRLIGLPFEEIPLVGDRVSGWIEGGSRELYDAYSAYFCGGSSASPPSYQVERARPSSADSIACETQCNPVEGPCPASCEDVTSEACGAFLNRACHNATQEAALYGDAYCHPDKIDRRATTTDGDAWCMEELHRWEGCFDDDRGTTNAVYRARQVPGSETGELTRQEPSLQQSYIQPRCMDRVQRASDQCRPGRDVMWSTELRYVLYIRSGLDAACDIHAVVVRPQALNNDLRHWRSHGPDRASNVCSDMSWRVGSGNRPFAASCAHDPLPAEWDSGTFVPNPSGDLTNPFADCNALPDSYADALSGLMANTNPQHLVREVKLVSRCIIEETFDVDIAFGGETAVENPSRWKPPQRICELSGNGAFFSRGCAESGDRIFHGAEEFQLRGVVIGERHESVANGGTRVATWSGPEQRPMRGVSTPDPSANIGIGGVNIWEAAHQLGRFSMSQAEFFWDQSERCTGGDEANGDGGGSHCTGFYNEHADEREWMWDMAWTARMRRIHFSDPGVAEAGAQQVDPSLARDLAGWFDAVFIH